MSEKLIINEINGSVKIPFTEKLITFEVIEKLYMKILPFLKARRKAGLKEGASRIKND